MKTFKGSELKKHDARSSRQAEPGHGVGLPRFLEHGDGGGEGLLIQREGNLPPVPRYQLPTPSLLQPPAPRMPRLGPDLELRLDDRTRQLALESLLLELNPDRLSSLVAEADYSRFTMPLPSPPRSECTPPEPSPAPARGEPAPPRPGTVGDVLRAVTTSPVLYPGYCRLTTLGEQEVAHAWNTLTPLEAAGVVTHVSVIALGALAGVASNPEARSFVLSQLNGVTLPIPRVDWLRVELYSGGDAVMAAMHVDVGSILQRYAPILGFGPGSPSALGGPPQREPDLPGGVSRAESGEMAALDAGFGGRVASAVSGGDPIPEEPRRRLQENLGEKLDQVRVHTDHGANTLAREAAAEAFTTGSHIFFRSGNYHPESDKGFHLLAHEATHVVQQQAGRASGTGGGAFVTSPDHPTEVEARAAADRITSRGDFSGRSPAAASTSASTPIGTIVQRDKSSGSTGPTTGAVDVPGGENKTPSDQDVDSFRP